MGYGGYYGGLVSKWVYSWFELLGDVFGLNSTNDSDGIAHVFCGSVKPDCLLMARFEFVLDCKLARLKKAFCV